MLPRLLQMIEEPIHHRIIIIKEIIHVLHITIEVLLPIVKENRTVLREQHRLNGVPVRAEAIKDDHLTLLLPVIMVVLIQVLLQVTALEGIRVVLQVTVQEDIRVVPIHHQVVLPIRLRQEALRIHQAVEDKSVNDYSVFEL